MGANQPNTTKKSLVCALLAHVDAGKTTLSEALLYTAGQLRTLGRVDKQSAFLDTFALERARGITIFSKEARLSVPVLELTLVDTPGHVDFAAEAERVLPVLDCAIVIISGTDGVQAHTQTIWQLLRRYGVPTFLFINKMDLPGPGREALLAELKGELSEGCEDLSAPGAMESAALCDEAAMEEYLASGTLSARTLARLVGERKLFPCCFGSALRLEGIDALLSALGTMGPQPVYPPEFSARVYKIARDPKGVRLTYLKVTGGSLRAREPLSYESRSGEPISEKIKELRLYSGEKFTPTETAEAGVLCAAVGLSETYPGQGLGAAGRELSPLLEPVMTYRIVPRDGTDPALLLPKLRQLAEEDPQLHIDWDARHREIHVRLMGRVQLEVLQSLVLERFDTEIQVDQGRILYKETIAAPVEGVGHFEPLRHYAEVHLLLEPLPRGRGIELDSRCSEDRLDRNWQRLVLTHLEEKTHLGVLTGSPLTDVRITLMSGRAHLKHTEGGDFRQATYRAVRQGLMQAESILLEPYYSFRLTVPQENTGRAIGDLQAMHASFTQSQAGAMTELTGTAAVSAMGQYAAEVAAYTKGRGRLSCTNGGYFPCRDQERLVAEAGYDPEADLENTPDSVFCARGAGFTVKWRDVPNYMHLPSCLAPEKPGPDQTWVPRPIEDRELEAIMDREFGPIRRPVYRMPGARASEITGQTSPAVPRKEYLVVDGYNILFAWEDLSALARQDLEAARNRLIDILSNYCGFRRREVVLVFDGYRVKGSPGEKFRAGELYVVYTRENETADAYIEALLEQIGKNDKVWVATSDSLVQLSAFRSGVLRLSARELRAEVEAAGGEIRTLLKGLEDQERLHRREANRRRWSGLLE